MSSKLLINESPLQILPTLAEKVGLNEAIVLQQIQYWLAINEKSNKNDHFHDGKWWTYNTKKDWQRQFPWWSEATVKRILKSLREKGLLLTTSEYNKKGYDRTLWYTIDYDKLNSLLDHSLGQNDPINGVKMTRPIPETNTKTTKDLKDYTPQREPRTDAHSLMVKALMETTKMDMKIKSNAGRIVRASKELREAGFTDEDVLQFGRDWKKDWRYRRDRKPPALTTLLSSIKEKINYEEQREREREIAQAAWDAAE